MNSAEEGKTMKTAKGINKKLVALVSLALINLFAVGAVSVAWFITMSRDSKIQAFSGDLNVDIMKVTAYKQVYPFYARSTEVIDYDGDPTLKGYVVEDNTNAAYNLPATTAPVSVISITSSSVSGNYVIAANSGSGPQSVRYDGNTNFSFFLLGDGVYTGQGTNDPWSTATAYAFAEQNVSNKIHPGLKNIVLSVGAQFTLFDVRTCVATTVGNVTTYSCNYYSYGTLAAKEYNNNDELVASESDPRFRVLTENGVTSIQCLKSGIYDFEYAPDSLTISLSDRDDEAIIGNNLVDPTKINIDYAAYTGPLTKDQYIPYAVKGQNTMVIFDVQLKFKNANPIGAGLKVYRKTEAPNESIFKLANRYSDTTHHLTGYQVNDGVVTRNAMDASDFYAFYAVIAKEENAFAPIAAVGNTPAKTAAEAMWDSIHLKTDDVDGNSNPLFTKFSNLGNTYEPNVQIPLHPKENTDSSVIGATDPAIGSTYHCYIGVEYDYDHLKFFMDGNRLGKRYLLDRDFGFYFSGTQLKTQVLSTQDDVNEVEAGSTLTITSNATSAITWTSSDTSVATVSGGVVTGVSTGTVTITAKADGYFDATFEVTVVESE